MPMPVNSSESEENYDNHFIQSVFQLLARLGIDPSTIVPGYEDPETNGYIALAFPEVRAGMSIEGDDPQPLIDDGWYIVNLSIGQLEAFAHVTRQLGLLGFENIRRQSEAAQVKTGSKEEERLLAALLAANIREPDRNFTIYRKNKTELTTPDFVWEDLKLAFFMDGLWWHVTKDDTRTINMMAEAGSDSEKGALLLDANKTRAERDTKNRSELAALGWRILACTDRDLATDKGVRAQVDLISRTMRMILDERAELTGLNLDAETRRSMFDLL